MAETDEKRIMFDERMLSVITHSLFSAWMLSFLFEGQIFYSLADAYNFYPSSTVFSGIAALFAGLLFCGLFIKTKKAMRRLFLASHLFFIAVSAFFFFPPSLLWQPGIIAASFLAGACVAGWAFCFKSAAPKNERIKMAADMLILSNIFMIILNTVSIYISPRAGLALAVLMLIAAFTFALKLPENDAGASSTMSVQKDSPVNVAKPLLFLSLFIVIITINSGLMYQVVNPAFAHLEGLTSWYWALPYIVALFVIKNLPARINRSYTLYMAIAMIGLSFVAFMSLGRGAAAYIVVDTLMMSACGIYDLFWWSILGEMLDYSPNPSKILGVGLSANVLGVLLGGLIGNAIISSNIDSASPTMLALAVVCVTLVMLPPLHKRLYSLLKDNAYLSAFYELPVQERTKHIDRAAEFGKLSERESQVAFLLLQGKTYRDIATELIISENTVKYYVKNIYSKFGVQSRAELFNSVLNREDAFPLA